MLLVALCVLAQTEKEDGDASRRGMAEQKKGRSLEELYRGSKEDQVAKEGRIEGIKQDHTSSRLSIVWDELMATAGAMAG